MAFVFTLVVVLLVIVALLGVARAVCDSMAAATQLIVMAGGVIGIGYAVRNITGALIAAGILGALAVFWFANSAKSKLREMDSVKRMATP